LSQRLRRQFFGKQLDEERTFAHFFTIGNPSFSRES
jgi:hypothetical protein